VIALADAARDTAADAAQALHEMGTEVVMTAVRAEPASSSRRAARLPEVDAAIPHRKG
jgi:cation transport ATPase